MKFRSLRCWQNPENSEGLLFFAQLLEELLFDYSLDTYKPSAMNTSTLCLEAKRLVQDIENELIDSNNLWHVLDELLLNIKNDEVAKGLLPIQLESIEKKFHRDLSIQEISIVLDLISSRLNISAYKAETERLLLIAVNSPREKGRIRALARSYVTTLVNFGYSTRFLYPTSRMYFYLNRNGISGNDSLSGFFKIVSGVPQNYAAVFKVGEIFDELKDSCRSFDLEVACDLNQDIKGFADSKSYSIGDGEVYLVVKGIKAMDVFSALDMAERRVNIVSTLSSLFHHKESAGWKPGSLLINLDASKARIVSKSQNPMLMCSDLKKESAAAKLNFFINNFSMEKQSFRRFDRAAELHALALRSDSSENQLLNLWVALETIVPSKLGRQKAKINNIVDSILPFLSMTYIDILTEKLTHDFLIWNRGCFYRLTNDIEGASDRDRLIKLLVLAENNDKKIELFANLRDFHLLRNRAHYFSEELSSKKKISKLLESHCKRVDWQIRRIYRTRNLVVHAGHTPPYIGILIKNIHDYLDIVLNVISRLASDGNNINTIDQAFKFMEIKYTEYACGLKEGGDLIDSGNVVELLLSGVAPYSEVRGNGKSREASRVGSRSNPPGALPMR